MRSGKASAATLGIAGGLALGIWIGAEMTSGRDAVSASAPAAAVTAAEASAPVAARSKRISRVSRAVMAERVDGSTREAAPKLVMTIPVSAPELHDRLKPVLARGTKMPKAVEGFSDAEQFATLAYAARNTQVPFVLLKHRVLAEGQSLADAIRASKPDLDAQSEVERARAEAKSDIAALSGNANDE